MTARLDRSLVAAWGVGLALCGAGAGVTSAAMKGRAGDADLAPMRVAARDTMHGLIVREAWDQTVAPLAPAVRGIDSAATAAEVGGVRAGRSETATGEVRGESAGVGGQSGDAPLALRPASRDASKGAVATGGNALSPSSPLAPALSSLTSPVAAGGSTPSPLAPRTAIGSNTRLTPRPSGRVFDSSLVVSLRDTLRVILDRAVRDSAFPGAYAVVGTSKGIVADYGAGRIDWAADAPVPNARTLWDLASLTKVIALTSAVARLVDGGLVDLDAPVQRYLPEFAGAGKERVTVRHLLTHSSGLPSWRPLHKEATAPEERRALVLATPLDTAPGARYVYSDLGAITLGFLIERVAKQPLDQFVARRVFEPLGMRDTRYRPDSSLLARIAPTEIDPWRQRHLRGEVHDENAFALGGVSAHAGLFSTGHDLARLARMYLGGGALDGRRFLARRTLERFTAVQDTAISRRALGWETPTGSNSAGRYLGRRAFGHTGFTGTSMWMDPERDLFVILLTNRVNPSRQNARISRVRVALADAVVQTVAAHGGTPAVPAVPPTPPR